MINNNRPKLVCAGPACGKTYATNELSKTHSMMDLDSGKYNWILDANNNQVLNPKFPQNYIEKIKEVYNSPDAPDYIFISPDRTTIDTLLALGYPIIAVVPNRNLKEVYMKVYHARGNSIRFIEKMDRAWDRIMDWLYGEQRFKKLIILEEGEYISDKLEEIKSIN